MVPDRVGFLYPKIDVKNCVACGRCEEVCPMRKGAFERTPTHVYALKHRDEATRLSSASGGAFSVLANKILDEGGIVYGAAFDSNWGVTHIRVADKLELARLRGSKYVQSRMGEIYKKVRDDLRNGLTVLFSGTPCQVAALNMFIGYRSELQKRLITVDLVCGGISNPRVWADYLREVGGDSVISVNFRDKIRGWRNFHLSILLSDGRIYTEHCWKNLYMVLFLRDFINRPSCADCAFRGGRSGATYTIADYWGIDVTHPSFFDDKGVSLLLQYDYADIRWMQGTADLLETSFKDAYESNRCIKQTILKGRRINLFYFFHDQCGMSVTRSFRLAKPFAAVEDRIRNKGGRVAKSVKGLLKRWLKV